MKLIGGMILMAAVAWPAAARSQSTGERDTQPAGTPSASRVSDLRNLEAASKDAEVLAKVHQANQMEIEAGRLAKKNGSSKAVSRFGELLIRDHGMADRMIVKYAKRRGVAIPAASPANQAERAEMEKQMAAMKKLQTLNGAAFDREFATTMAAAHEMAIRMVGQAKGMVSDPDLRNLLGKMLPILEQHRKIAQDLGARAPRS